MTVEDIPPGSMRFKDVRVSELDPPVCTGSVTGTVNMLQKD